MHCARWMLGLLLGSLLVTSATAATPEEQQADAVAALRRVATNVQKNRDDGTVRLVRLSKSTVTDESLAILRSLTTIDYLAVDCPQVGDAGLAHVGRLTNLDTLLLTRTSVSDAGLAELGDLQKLERLYLDDTRISDKGLAHLGELASLRKLSLAGTAVKGPGLVHVAKLPKLELLFLDATSADDGALEHVASLDSLRTLSLDGTRVGDAGVIRIAHLPQLENLSLIGTSVTDESVAALAALPAIKHLTLYRTPITATGIWRLREALPKTAIHADVKVDAGPPLAHGKRPGRTPSDLGPILPPARERISATDEVPDFQRHVVPLLGRLGCNGRACHGSFQGQGGFQLSMFGYDFAIDHKSLTGGDAPRVDITSPAESLLLNKPTSQDDHGGGERFRTGDWHYDLLHRWIAGGAPSVKDDAATFVRLDVTPAEFVFQKNGQTAELCVIAVWSDGSREDVTCLTRFESNDEGIAQVDANGVIRGVGAGDTHIIALYDNGIAAIPVMRPVSDQTGDRYPKLQAGTRIDELILDKLTKLGIVPSEPCSDEAFLRRVSLDIAGSLPTPSEIRSFLQDPRADKRARKIEQLLDSPAYVAWWTMKLCDLTGSNAGYLGGTEMAQPVAQQWRDWIERRVRDNVGFDEIVEGLLLARSRAPGQTYAEFTRRQSGHTRRSDPTDYAAVEDSMPHFWFRSNLSKPEEKALAFGYTFLGIRLQCAQCHKHPYDQWSKQDFEQFTSFFARIRAGVAPDATWRHEELREMLGVPVKLNTAALRRQSYLRIASEGRPIPWREVFVEPPGKGGGKARLLGAGEVNLDDHADPRVPLMQWLRSDANPYFARALVNRIWAHYMGVGIVDPPDDLNMANPPSNQPLLDHLSRQFVAQGYDLKWLHREITRSDAYQRSWQPNDTNRRDRRNFSRALARRLPAEVVVDGIIQATANQAKLDSFVENTATRKISQHPKSYQARSIDYSLLVFGKPLRSTNCDCERKDQPTLLQALYVRNDQEILQLLERADGWLVEVARRLGQSLESEATSNGQPLVASTDRSAPDEAERGELVREAYLRTLGRLPTAAELKDCAEHLALADNDVEGLRDLLWALLNTQEFITNH